MNLTEEYALIVSLPPKERFHKLKALAHRIGANLDELNESEIHLALQIVQTAIKVSGFPQALTRIRSKLIQQKIKQLGISEITIQKKKNYQIAVESGTIVVGDPSIASKFNFTHFDESELLSFMQQQKGLVFGTGGDGVFDTQLRLVNGPEPLLTEKEYRCMVGASDVSNIEVITGKIGIADLGNLTNSTSTLEIENGKYKTCVYLFDNKKGFRSFYIVLSKTEHDTTEPIRFCTLE